MMRECSNDHKVIEQLKNNHNINKKIIKLQQLSIQTRIVSKKFIIILINLLVLNNNNYQMLFKSQETLIKEILKKEE